MLPSPQPMKTYRTMDWNGMIAVIESESDLPQIMEAIALFYNVDRAEEYLNALTIVEEKFAAALNLRDESTKDPTGTRNEEILSEEQLKEFANAAPGDDDTEPTSFALTDQQQKIMKVLLRERGKQGRGDAAVEIEENEVALSQAEIARETGISPGSVYYALRRLMAGHALKLRRNGNSSGPSVFKIADAIITNADALVN